MYHALLMEDGMCAEVVLAKGVDEEDDITASVSVSGTRGFMAPEVYIN